MTNMDKNQNEDYDNTVPTFKSKHKLTLLQKDQEGNEIGNPYVFNGKFIFS